MSRFATVLQYLGLRVIMRIVNVSFTLTGAGDVPFEFVLLLK